MAGLIDDDRMVLFFIKDPLYGDTETIGDYTNAGYSAVEVSFKIVAEWVCNAKVVVANVSWIDTEDGESIAGYPLGPANCTRGVIDIINYTYIPINVVGIPLFFGSESLLFSYADNFAPFFRDFEATNFGAFNAGSLLVDQLRFICVAEKWYHIYFSTSFFGTVTVTVSMTKLTFKVVTSTSIKTYTYEITETFY